MPVNVLLVLLFGALLAERSFIHSVRPQRSAPLWGASLKTTPFGRGFLFLYPQSSPYFSIHACGTVPKLSSQSLNFCRLQPRPAINRRRRRSFSNRPSQ